MGLNLPPANMGLPAAAPLAAPANPGQPVVAGGAPLAQQPQQPGVAPGAPIQPGVEAGVLQPGAEASPEDLQMMGQVLMGAIQELFPGALQMLMPQRQEPSVFDLAKQLNQSGDLRLNPLGKEVLKKKTDDNTEYFMALGYSEDEE